MAGKPYRYAPPEGNGQASCSAIGLRAFRPARSHSASAAGVAPLARDELLAEDGNALRRLDPDADLVAPDGDDRDGDLIANHNPLIELATQDQHLLLLS